MIARRDVLIGAAATVGSAIISPLRAKPFEWQTAAPADAGFAPDLEARFDKLIESRRIWNQHGVVVVRGGRIVLERYFAGEENNWGNIRTVSFGPETLHILYSVTKSIVALVYGIALAEGKVPPPDAPLYAQFPEYADLVPADERRKQITVAHALSMSLGVKWTEIGLAYNSTDNEEIGMEMAADRYRFILDRPIIGPPGKRWVYSGGATALLGRLIAKGTGQSLPDYARKALFDPIGLGPTEWLTSGQTWVARETGRSDGEPIAASGLSMSPRDLARIGQLVLDDGVADGKQIVPLEWLAACLTPRLASTELMRYGYQWYVGDMEFRDAKRTVRLEHWVGCYGNGGQRLFVFPDLELIVVTTFNNLTPDQWIPPVRVVREAVLPSLL